MNFLTENYVAIEPTPASAYEHADLMASALGSLGRQLGWGNEDEGTFARVIPDGARVLVKPNWVLHENTGPWPFDAVVTHSSLVQMSVAELLRTRLSEVHLGDAPVQGCDFERLLQRTGLDAWAQSTSAKDPRFTGIKDFRRTTATFTNGIRVADENKVDKGQYLLFDLGHDSLLEPVTTEEPLFRVTCYDPKLLAQTHSPGRHQYLIARDALEADVVINLPKLKMHRKAGVTNALKNLVGINGNKEYLPHHRIGGTENNGDCYPGKSRLKEAIERLYDFQNASSDGSRARLVAPLLRPLARWLAISGDETGIEGSWSGNDTVWRMSLDLNRILMYGKTDGTMSDLPQRTVLHLCDAIIAGQGDGPLAPQAFQLEILLAGSNAAALDLVGAHLLGMNPARIPIITGAFGRFRWPLTAFSQEAVCVHLKGNTVTLQNAMSGLNPPRPEHVPAGWKSIVKL